MTVLSCVPGPLQVPTDGWIDERHVKAVSSRLLDFCQPAVMGSMRFDEAMVELVMMVVAIHTRSEGQQCSGLEHRRNPIQVLEAARVCRRA